MAEALDQLRAGVPLNWTQVEDDPELATLSYLEEVASEGRGRVINDTPAALRESILGDLSKRLPKPKPVVVKEAPKSLAGFSESVPVLTQAEEKVPQLISRAPQIAGAIALAVGAIFLLSWGISALTSRPPEGIPTYRWIEVKQDGKALTRLQRPDGWSSPNCNGYSFGNIAARREYVSIPDTQQIQINTGFPIVFLPRILAVPEPPTSTATYVMGLSGMGIAPCEEAFNTNDRGATVKIEYMANLNLDDGGTKTSPLSIFQARQMPATLDVGTGSWREVTIGGSHGVYWRGGPYRDMSGSMWIGDVSVMMIERGDSVLILVGQTSPGVNEGFLTEAVKSIDSERQGEENIKSQSFAWIDVWRGSQLLLAKKLPGDWKAPDCFGSNEPSLFVRIRNGDSAQARVGYPIIKLPETLAGPTMIAQQNDVERFPSGSITPSPAVTITLATTYTMRLADVGILTCNREPADPDTKVKLRYSVRIDTEKPIFQGPVPDIVILQDSNIPQVSDIVVFQTRRVPIAHYVEGGQWKEVQVGDARGVYWSGSQYHDMEGLYWQDGANVLIVERGDMVVTLISRSSPESLLESVAEGIDWAAPAGP
jgi:hypothetical protein